VKTSLLRSIKKTGVISFAGLFVTLIGVFVMTKSVLNESQRVDNSKVLGDRSSSGKGFGYGHNRDGDNDNNNGQQSDNFVQNSESTENDYDILETPALVVPTAIEPNTINNQETLTVQPQTELQRLPVSPTDVIQPVVQNNMENSERNIQNSFGSNQNIVPINSSTVVTTEEVTTTNSSDNSVIKIIKKTINSVGVGKQETQNTIVPIQAPNTNSQKKEDLEVATSKERLKLKYQLVNGGVALVPMGENGTPVVLSENDVRNMEITTQSKLKDSGVSMGTVGEKFAITKNGVTVLTDLPVSVDLDSGRMMILSNNALLPIKVLPDKAAANLTQLDTNGEINKEISPVIEISGGEVVYRFEGSKPYKMFGFININALTTTYVSADSGEIVSKKQPFVSDVIRLFSI